VAKAKRIDDLVFPKASILSKVSTMILLERLAAAAAVLTTGSVPAVGTPP
jgi:hypothetical protein